MTEILPALEILVNNNCLTVAEALEKSYLAGHRVAVKNLEPVAPILVAYSGENVTSPRGKSQK